MYRFISAEKAIHHVRTLCRVLGVSSSGYYAWCSRPPSIRSLHDAELTRAIVRIHENSRGNYGRPRIHAELRYEGMRCSGKRVARLMRHAGISGIPARRKRRGLTRRRPGVAPHPDLVGRRFSAPQPDRLWVADIERHEALLDRAVMKGHRRQPVAAGWLKLGAARPRGREEGWTAAPTTPGRVGTARRPGSGKRDGKVYVRNQRSKTAQVNPPARTWRIGAGERRAPALQAGNSRAGGMSPAGRPRGRSAAYPWRCRSGIAGHLTRQTVRW
jgi:hypothetical protein